MSKYGEQEQVTVKNHKRNTALEQSVLEHWGGGLKRFYGKTGFTGTGFKTLLLILTFTRAVSSTRLL